MADSEGVKLLALVLAFAFLPGVALAQQPTATPTPGIEDENTTDPVDQEGPVEGDDAYTCGNAGTDGDYVYCNDSGAGTPGPVQKRKPVYTGGTRTVSITTLPYTGTSPGLVALLRVPGLGPKKIKTLYDDLKVTSLARMVGVIVASIG